MGSHPLARLGPGLITGVADDDPGGIATHSQAGAAYGLGMLWTMPFTWPLVSAIQIMAARLGRVTGKGLAANIREAFPAPVLRMLVGLLLFANLFNIAADIAAMGEAAEMVTGFPRQAMTVALVAATLGLQILVPYHRYVFFLKWMTLSLLAYVGLLFTVHIPWRDVLSQLVWPRIRPDGATATMVAGVLGTTISPYLFFWQASEEIEDMRGAPSLLQSPATAEQELRRINFDTWTGMLYSGATSFFIILATAVTLHPAGIIQIESAVQAASALRPIAGDFAGLIFAAGILGVGLIAIPVLAASAGYAMCETMGWQWGLERTAHDARAFYGVIAASILLALAFQFLPINPMRALFWSAVANGIVAVPLLLVLIWLVTRREVMGPFRPPAFIVGLACFATLAMALAGGVTLVALL